ncbi:unnamed protein product [Rotaria magnacalcarata]|uniref:F-box domain-containing protein n=1 Tax=Rotaria magnacalcarata TaxID=392030 RepID=A0A820E3W4_9BILA|nr:unnamed protein product [Rotaria magnacalcarata]CAF1406382.1 unnamed protein product [Rotaria magnacalcarata]CAF1978801.1 unnamed protein product [Rotaria magnacalcarata]CAF2027352.1 unnamed protein product [Rotaria magnacalcarata]CAF2154307.1 unnamed protein product [Rotaria magnacalcarata]
MVCVSFVSLPIGLLHRIFDFFDTQTILLAIGRGYHQLHAVSNSYNRLKFTYHSSSQYNLKIISRYVCLENIISLTIKNENINNDRIDRFVKLFGTCEFRRLSSLAVINCTCEQLENLLQHIDIESPITLSIDLHSTYRGTTRKNLLPPDIFNGQVIANSST